MFAAADKLRGNTLASQYLRPARRTKRVVTTALGKYTPSFRQPVDVRGFEAGLEEPHRVMAQVVDQHEDDVHWIALTRAGRRGLILTKARCGLVARLCRGGQQDTHRKGGGAKRGARAGHDGMSS